MIVVTEPPEAKLPGIGHALLDSDPVSHPHTKPVVLLMDYEQESRQFMTPVALELALFLARRRRTVFFLKRSVKTAGTDQERLYQEARGAGVVFVDYDQVQIAETDQGFAHVSAQDESQSLEIGPCSLIVAETIHPGKTGALADCLKLRRDRWGFIDEYKHYLYPVMTSRRGVYAIDTLRACCEPEYLEEAIAAVIGDSAEQLTADANLLYVELDKEKCAFCYTCYRACPHAALTPNQAEAVMEPWEEACFGCGICVSMCPANALQLTLEKPAQGASQSVQIFCCENSGDTAISRLQEDLANEGLTVSQVSVTCGGEITVERLLQALRQYEKVIAAVCMDDACQHFDGNRRACAQTERAVSMLEAAGLEPGRIRFVQLSQGMPRLLHEEIREALL